MKVLIIGGSRFLGREITLRLVARGDEVTLVNRGRTEAELPEGVERLIADIDLEGALRAATEGRSFDAALHMIAMNGRRAEVVIDAIGDRVGQYVQCGSTGVFMPLRYVPADEEHPVDPPPDEWGGFNGKAASDRAARERCAAHGLPLTILRPTAIIGPGDELLDYWGGRDPRLLQRVLDGEPIILPERGEGLVQFGDVRDLAEAFVLTIGRPERAGEYTISSRYAITHNYLAELLFDALGITPSVAHLPAEEIIARYEETGMVSKRGMRFYAAHMCFTIDKARRELGYEPAFTAEQSVPDTVGWMLDHGLIGRR